MKFEPTDELRRKVKVFVGCGVPQQQICQLIGIRSVKTLRKHFRAELELGPLEALAKVQQTAFRMATSGRSPRMTIRWLERRARWAPGMRSRPEPGEVVHHQFVIEEYQPPMDADDPRRNLASLLHDNSTPTSWEGDDSAIDGDDDD